MKSDSEAQGTQSVPSDDTTGQSSVRASSTRRPPNRFYDRTNLALQCLSTIEEGPMKALSILLLSKYRDDTGDWRDETFREKLIGRWNSSGSSHSNRSERFTREIRNQVIQDRLSNSRADSFTDFGFKAGLLLCKEALEHTGGSMTNEQASLVGKEYNVVGPTDPFLDYLASLDDTVRNEMIRTGLQGFGPPAMQ